MKQNKAGQRKKSDQAYKQIANVLLLLLLMTGVISAWFDSIWRSFAHWNQIAHLVLGCIAALPLLIYLWQHFVATLGVRKPLLLATGLMSLFPILWLMGTGFWTLAFGEYQTHSWVSRSHSYASYALVIFLLVHLILYWPTAKRKSSSTSNSWVYVFISCFIALLAGISGIHALSTDRTDLSEVPQNYSLTYYGDNPFAPSQNTTPGQKLIPEHAIANSQQCGSCHQDIYQQWHASIHRQSASDPTYVSNINLLESKKGIDATRYCEGCHAPVAIMTGALTPGGMHGGNPESAAHHEGVGCTSCHRITDIEHTKGTASYHFEPAVSGFISNPDTYLERTLNNLVIRTDAKAHATEMTDPTLYTTELCATCHEQFMDESMNDWGYVTMQHLYSDWLESPFSGQNDQEYANQQLMRCQDCHMPLIEANDPSADKNGMVRSHRFPGANTAIPWLNGDHEQLDIVQRFMQEGRVTIKAEPVPRDDAPENQSSISEQLLPGHSEQQPYFLYLNETGDIRVSVFNRMVGHSFPAGTTDLNEVWIEFTVRDAENRIVYRSGGIDSEGVVDPAAYFYKSVPVDRRGNEVWRHDLFNMVGDAYSNLIQAGETDIKNYQFQVPAWAKGPISIDARVKYRKFNARYANWALADVPNYELAEMPITEIARDQITVPVYKRAPVINR